ESWEKSPQTPGAPNIAVFQTTGKYGGEQIWITNGIREDLLQTEGIDDTEITNQPSSKPETPVFLGENISVSAGPGVNNTVINLIREHLNFSLNFYREHNFTDPQMAKFNVIDVRVSFDNSRSESVGACYPNGTIVITLGANWTKEELKVVGEHELMHAFQFRKSTDANGTYHHVWIEDRWWIEGQAEFWGFWSMLENYPHMSYKSWMQMAQNIGGLNWFDHYRDLNGSIAFENWTDTWNAYMASFLFMKFINETYSWTVFVEVFNMIKYYGPGSPHNVEPKDAFEQVVGKSWEELYGDFLTWLLLDAHTNNGLPVFEPHISLNYSGLEINDTVGVRGWGGAVVEEIEINNDKPFFIRLNNTYADNHWVVRILVFHEDGTNETINVPMNSTTQFGEIYIDPSINRKIAKIWLIKSLPGLWSGRITTSIVPEEIELDYNEEEILETVEVTSGKRIYETININGTKPFIVNLNSTENSLWNITIIRHWDNGSINRFTISMNKTFTYYVNPVFGDGLLTHITFVKHNLNDFTANITLYTDTLAVFAAPLFHPWEIDSKYPVYPVEQASYGFGRVINGFFYIEGGKGYQINITLPDVTFEILLFDNEMNVFAYTEIVESKGTLELGPSDTISGMYYLAIRTHSGHNTGYGIICVV
ncbi:MAG: hypothetical protein ABEK36_03325, partial [Candidatus Aenigmatarchaeota archaeon]